VESFIEKIFPYLFHLAGAATGADFCAPLLSILCQKLCG
jgi:hypothetical protein